MGVIFLGTPAFAVPTLEALLAAGYPVNCVITQPDRPKGRHQETAASAVKQCALMHGLPVYQPERVRRPEAVEHIRGLAPEIMVVVGYGQIIPQSILDIPPKGIINVHASLLPRLRGAAPVQWSIVRGDRTTGVTTMKIDAGLDTGAILLRSKTEIGPEEDAVQLAERLSLLGAELLVETLDRIDTLAPESQNNAEATLAPILKKEDGRIDWSREAEEIHNQVRGLVPWPGAHTEFHGRLLHVWKSRVPETRTELPPGLLLAKHGRGAAQISCGGGTVLDAIEMQMEGRKRVTGAAFMNGLHLEENVVLGAVSL